MFFNKTGRLRENVKLNLDFVRIYFRLGFPMILSQLMVYLINNFSVAMIGTLSSDAISGYTAANESFSIVSMLILGLTGGFHIYIAQYYGDGNKKKYNQVLRFGTRLALGLGLGCAALFLLIARPFVSLFVQDGNIVSFGVSYLKVFAWTFIPYSLNTLWSGAYQMTGRAHITFISGAVNCLTNLAFCYILLLGRFGIQPMGIKGAAMALLIARCCESIFLFVMLNRKSSEFKFGEKYDRLKGGEVTNIFKTSWLLVANELLFSIAYMIIAKNYGYVSDRALGCFTVAKEASQLVFVFTQGISAVIGVLVGGELGAGNLDRAKANGSCILKLTFILYAIGGVVLAALSPFIPAWYSLTGDLAALTTKMLLVKAVIFFGGMSMFFYNILRVGGDTKSVFLLDGCFSMVFPMGISCLCTYVLRTDFLTLYIAVESMSILKWLLGYYFYRKGNWRKRLS